MGSPLSTRTKRGHSRSAATAAGLVVWLASLAGSNDELPASTDPDAVNVLTYHRSKGLEWPMVILLDLENARDGSAFGFTVEADEEFDVWRPLDGRWVRFWPWPYGAQRKDVHIDATVFGTEEHLSATQREHAEAVRLLYVGATRARDYLARRIHGCRSLTVDFTRAWAGVRRFSAPGVEVVSVGVRG